MVRIAYFLAGTFCAFTVAIKINKMNRNSPFLGIVTIIFFEDFENQLSSSFISGNGWTHFIAAGSEG